MTERKKDMIADSRSKEQNEAVGLANLMNESEEPISIGYRDIKIWLELMCNRALYDSDVEIKRSMRDAGVFFSKGRVSLDGRMQALCMNAAMTEKIIGKGADEGLTIAKSYRKMPSEVNDEGNM